MACKACIEKKLSSIYKGKSAVSDAYYAFRDQFPALFKNGIISDIGELAKYAGQLEEKYQQNAINIMNEKCPECPNEENT